jgi:hypothetical protein
VTAIAGMCHKYSVIAPPLPTATARHTRGRAAQRRIGPAAATNTHDIHVQCSASNNVGGDTLDIRSAPVTTRETS